MEITLLVDRFGYQKDIDDIQTEWLDNIFMYLELNPVELKEMKPHVFIDTLYNKNIEIIRFQKTGAMIVKHKGEIVGKWAGPELTLEKDNKKGELYYKISIQQWSILDEEIDLS